MYRWQVFIILMALVSASCNVTRVVKPLDKGAHQVTGSFGGPAIIFSGLPMPIPYSSVGYAYGLDTGLTVAGGVHTTALLFGNAQVDLNLGIRTFQTASNKFGVTTTPGVHLFYGFRGGEAMIYPQIEALAWWKYADRENMFYGGAGTWVELQRQKAYGEVQSHEFMPYVTLGHQFVRKNWSFQLEARYIGFLYANDNLVVDYLGPFPVGTSGVYFGVSRQLFKP